MATGGATPGAAVFLREKMLADGWSCSKITPCTDPCCCGIGGCPMTAIDLVHRQLEFLKYVPGWKPGKDGPEPTGQGIEVDIALLPDLLLDFRDYNVEHFDSHIKTCTVGGRAARMACALLHLTSDDDGTFNVHLLTRTGNLGRLLLENEFYRTNAQRVLAQCLESVSVGMSEPRCAVWDKREGPPTPQPPMRSRELTAALCRRLGHEAIIQQARTVCLTAVGTPDFQQLFKFVTTNLTAAQAGLFLDTSRAATRRDLTEKLLGAVNNLEEVCKRRICGLFLSLETSEQLDLKTPEDLSKWSANNRLPLIQYGIGNEIRYASPAGTPVVSIRHHAIPFGTEDVSERFKAGVLLASTVHRTIVAIRQQANGSGSPVVAPPFAEAAIWNKMAVEWQPNEWEIILKYGCDLATVQTSRSYCSFEDLVTSVTPGADSDHLPSGYCSPTEITPTWAAAESEFHLGGDEGRPLSRLAGLRRTKTLRQPSLAKCTDPQCRQGCRRTSGQPAAAVLIDLDGTLMDSTEQRRRGLIAALSYLDPRGVSQENVDFFEKEVYGQWAIFKALGLGDYRQEWNHPGWYRTYLVLQKNPKLLAALKKAPEICLREFEAKLRGVAEKHGHAIRAAQQAFAGTAMVPFKEARDFLESLRASQGVHLYICSEGVPDAQWEKIQRAGLDAYFPRERVLTTGEATEMAEERRHLSEEKGRLEKRLAQIKEKNARLRGRLRERTEVIDDIAISLGQIQKTIFTSIKSKRTRTIDLIKANKESADLMGRQLQAADFVEKVLDRLANKAGLSFYAATIRSILRNPRAPVEQLRSMRCLREVQRKVRPMKFAMVGDRHTKDIHPPRKLLGDKKRLLAIRVVSGRYASDADEPLRGRDESDAPTFIVYTLAQAKALLLAKSVWEEIRCADDPPLFGCRLLVGEGADNPPTKLDADEAEVGLNRVLGGGEMQPNEFPTISKICGGGLGRALAPLRRSGRDSLNLP